MRGAVTVIYFLNKRVKFIVVRFYLYLKLSSVCLFVNTFWSITVLVGYIYFNRYHVSRYLSTFQSIFFTQLSYKLTSFLRTPKVF